MRIFDNFEKNFLFGLTRIFAMMIILGILISIGIGGLLFGGYYGGVDTTVTVKEVLNSINPPVITNALSIDANSSAKTTENANVLLSVKMPFILQKNFNTPEKLHTLKNWLDFLTITDRQEFINEMAATVTEADKLNLSSTEVVNEYKRLKFKKLEAEQSTKTERQSYKLYYAAATVGALALIALFSLILVLLAIERNTRRIEK